MYPQMTTYYWKEKDKIHAENWVMGMKGQTHIHTLGDWERWKKESIGMGIEVKEIKEGKTLGETLGTEK